MFQKLHRLLICQIIISGQRHAGGSMDKNPHFHKQISGVRASGHSRQIDLIDYISGITVQDLIHAFRLMLTALVTGYKQKFKNLDYDILMQLTLQLTKSMEECEKLYRLMCFNVYAHNRDDHSKNFTYLYDEDECSWKLSPAYDLTYSNSIGGEHATTVNGNGVNPELDDILAVAKKIGLNMTMARKTALNIRDCVSEMLGEYL